MTRFARSQPRSTIALAAALCAGTLLVACNGGDGSDTGSSPSAAAAHAKSSTVVWHNAPGGAAIALDTNDNVYTATSKSTPGADIELTRRDASGVVAWTRALDNPLADRVETPSSLAATSDGDVIVAGTSSVPESVGSDVSADVRADVRADVGAVVMRVGPDGTPRWRTELASIQMVSARSVLADAQGNSYVAGQGYVPGRVDTTAVVVKLDPAGQLAWIWRDESMRVGIAGKLVWSSDQRRLIVVADPADALGGANVPGAVAVLAPGRGRELRSIITYDLRTYDAAGDADGNVYVIVNGSTRGSSGIARYTADGGVAWTNVIGSTTFLSHVALAGDSLPVAAGLSVNNGTYAAKLGADGQITWQTAGGAGTGTTLAALRLDASDNVLLAAANASGALGNTVVSKLSATGTTLWSTVLEPCTARLGFALGGDGSPFVTADGWATARLGIDAAAEDPPVPPPAPCPAAPPVPQSAVTAVSLTDDADPVVLGQPWHYDGVVQNTGTYAAGRANAVISLVRGLRVTDIAPSQGTCSPDAANLRVVCYFGFLGPGAQANVRLTMQARRAGFYNVSLTTGPFSSVSQTTEVVAP